MPRATVVVFKINVSNTKDFLAFPLYCTAAPFGNNPPVKCVRVGSFVPSKWRRCPFKKLMMSAWEEDMAGGVPVTVGGEPASCGPCLQWLFVSCRGPTALGIPSVVRPPETAAVSRNMFSIWGSVMHPLACLTTLKVNMCETAHRCASDRFLAPAVSPSFSTFPSPQTPMFLQKHSQLFWGSNGQNM